MPRTSRALKIGDWPFERQGVDCRVCLRAPCRCPPLFFPFGRYSARADEPTHYDAAEVMRAIYGPPFTFRFHMERDPKTGKEAVRSITFEGRSRRGPRPKK